MNTSTVLVRALLAYSVHEHQDGTATQLHLTLQPRSCTVQDNGRGMGLDRDGYVVGLLEQLAARRSEVALHGIGLAIIAMSSPLLRIESRRNGRLSAQAFAWGVAQGPVCSEPAEGATGTCARNSMRSNTSRWTPRASRSSQGDPMNTDDASDRRFVHSRLIAATPEQVFSAFSQPERLARWWGPDGFTSTFEAFDLRPGGTWRFVMHGPDGTGYPNANVFKTVEPPNRVEVEHISEDHHFVLSITFTGQGSQTLVGWEQTFDTVEHKQLIAPWVETANEHNLERLQREVTGVDNSGAA